VYPVRDYSDPYEGLETQLAELKGLVRIVPPLIETDRNRRWDEIGKRYGDLDEDMIDIYEREAGPEECWGHADFARTTVFDCHCHGVGDFQRAPGGLCKSQFTTSQRLVVLKAGDTPPQIIGNGFSGR